MQCDYTISGATIYTLAEEGQTFSVMGVQGRQIVYLGESLPDDPGQVLGMVGRTIVPGFTDTHVHFSAAALLSVGLDVRFCRSFSDIHDSLLSYAESDAYEGGPIVGFGLMSDLLAEGRVPNRFDLDRMLAEPAVAIVGGEGHSVAVNSLGLKYLDLPAATRGIDRDPVSGETTGILRAEAYFRSIEKLNSAFSAGQLLRGLNHVANALLSRGVTSLHASEGLGIKGDLDVLGTLAIAPALDIELRMYLQSRSVRLAKQLGLTQIGGCFATAIDGSPVAHTAAFFEPYLDRPADTGMVYFTQRELDAFVLEAHRAGMQVNLHAIGDRAIDMAIAAYERALAASPRPDHRHRIEHCAFPSDAHLERIAALGLIVSTQPIFGALDPRLMEAQAQAIGEARLARAMPLRSMFERGIVVAGSSDMPVVDSDPLAGVQAAVLHPNLDQRISVYQALRMHTFHGALAGFQERRKGTLEVGKDADFVVLERDPFHVAPATIRHVPITATYVGGARWQPRPLSWPQVLGRPAGKMQLLRAFANRLLDRAEDPS